MDGYGTRYVDVVLQFLSIRPVEHSSIKVPGRVRLVPIHALTIWYVFRRALLVCTVWHDECWLWRCICFYVLL